jgi:plastocyanin
MKPKRSIPALLAMLALAAAFAVPAFASTHTVSVKDNFFGKRTITISKGSRIHWVWRGRGRHNVVVARGPASFRSGIMRHGSYSHTFTRRGTYQLVCTVHAGMNETVHVH